MIILRPLSTKQAWIIVEALVRMPRESTMRPELAEEAYELGHVIAAQIIASFKEPDNV